MAKRSKQSPEFWASLNTISGGRIAPVPGGVLIVEAKGRSVKDSPLATGIAATPATDVHSEDHRSALDRKVLRERQ